MGKGKNSLSRTAASLGAGLSASVIDMDGIISLNVSDYAGLSRDEIEDLLMQLPYETKVTFAPDGTLVSITSDFAPGSVGFNIRDIDDDIIRHDPTSDGSGYVDVHFHPLNGPNGIALQIFSPYDNPRNPGDLFANEQILRARERGYSLPDSFYVKASDGSWFQLSYVGPSRSRRAKPREELVFDYTNFFHGSVLNDASNVYFRSGSRAAGDYITARLNRWLTNNARRYGFRYNTNWSTRPSDY